MHFTILDMVATFGETTGTQALKCIKDRMMNSPEGNEILQYSLNLKYTNYKLYLDYMFN